MNKNLVSAVLFLGILVSPFLFSCGGKKAENVVEIPGENSNDDEGFGEFYKRFHQDPEFQLERITFPLRGLPMMADSMLLKYGEHYYEKDGWKILQEVDWDTSKTFVRTLEPTGIGIVNEYICTHDKFCISRRFAKLHNGWNLIYYEDLNYRGGGF